MWWCSAASCSDGTGGAIVITVTNTAALTNDTDDKGGYVIPVINNIVDTQKVDTSGAGGITNGDLLSGRVGSDTVSGSAGLFYLVELQLFQEI